MKSDFLAIDIALFLPDTFLHYATNIIEYDAQAPFKLNNTDCLPHISLAMGVVKAEDIDKLVVAFEDGAYFQQLDIKLLASKLHTAPNGKEIAEISIESSPQILALHLWAMKTLQLFRQEIAATTNMFLSPPEVVDVSTHWVDHYYHKKSVQDFRPHITLGEGTVQEIDASAVHVTRLGLAKLGTYCTCRRIVHSVQLT